MVFVKRGYKLGGKFNRGSHGEVWRAQKIGDEGGYSEGRGFVLKRIFLVSSSLSLGLLLCLTGCPQLNVTFDPLSCVYLPRLLRCHLGLLSRRMFLGSVDCPETAVCSRS